MLKYERTIQTGDNDDVATMSASIKSRSESRFASDVVLKLQISSRSQYVDLEFVGYRAEIFLNYLEEFSDLSRKELRRG